MYLIPYPQKLTMAEGSCRLTWKSRITLDASCSRKSDLHAGFLAEEIRTASGLKLMIDRRMSGAHSGILLKKEDSVKEKPGRESYTLKIEPDGVTVTGADDEGLLNGIQTLRQIVRQYGCMLPCLMIEDYPDLPARGWFHDITRCRVPKMDFMKRMADICSFYKLNQIHLNIEHTFLFDGLSEVWRDDTPFTAEDILELDAYCADRGIDLVPSISTFGHFYKLLRTRSFRHLSEIEEEKDAPFSFVSRMHHHTLNSTDEEALRLVYRMLDEFSPLFRSSYFNIACDETFDLGKGRGKARADEVGSHTMYLDWVKKICVHVRELGKRPMFWGDIIAAHPETIKELPEDIICLNWDYGFHVKDTAVRSLWENGASQYLCPGVQGWNLLINHYPTAYANIRCMAEYAHGYEGIGLLNTDWGDYGHIHHAEFSVPGLAYSSAMSWNKEIPSEEELNRAVSVLEYGDASGRVFSVISRLSDQNAITWGDLVRFADEYRYQSLGKGIERLWAEMRPRLENRLPRVESINAAIDACQEEICLLMRSIDPQNCGRLQPYLLMSDGQKLFNRMLPVLAPVYGYPKTELSEKEDPKALAEELETWYYEYRKLWHEISRESELYRIGEVIFWLADYLRDLA